MGYYTTFYLDMKADNDDYVQDVEEYIEHLNSADDPDGYLRDLDTLKDGRLYVNGKWYDHQDDITRLSVRFPEVLFILDGEGEESGDIWREYYKNGKTKRLEAEIVFPAFDPKELD